MSKNDWTDEVDLTFDRDNEVNDNYEEEYWDDQEEDEELDDEEGLEEDLPEDQDDIDPKKKEKKKDKKKDKGKKTEKTVEEPAYIEQYPKDTVPETYKEHQYTDTYPEQGQEQPFAQKEPAHPQYEPVKPEYQTNSRDYSEQVPKQEEQRQQNTVRETIGDTQGSSVTGFVMGDDGRIHSANYDKSVETARDIDQSGTRDYTTRQEAQEKYGVHGDSQKMVSAFQETSPTEKIEGYGVSEPNQKQESKINTNAFKETMQDAAQEPISHQDYTGVDEKVPAQGTVPVQPMPEAIYAAQKTATNAQPSYSPIQDNLATKPGHLVADQPTASQISSSITEIPTQPAEGKKDSRNAVYQFTSGNFSIGVDPETFDWSRFGNGQLGTSAEVYLAAVAKNNANQYQSKISDSSVKSIPLDTTEKTKGKVSEKSYATEDKKDTKEQGRGKAESAATKVSSPDMVQSVMQDHKAIHLNGEKHKYDASYNKVGNKVTRSLENTLKQSAEVREDKDTRYAKESFQDILSLAAAIGAAGNLDMADYKLNMLAEHLEKADKLVASGKINMDDLTGGLKKSELQDKLLKAGLSKSDAFRLASDRNDLKGLVEIRSTLQNNLTETVNLKLNIVTDKNISISQMRALLRKRLESIPGMPADLSGISERDIMTALQGSKYQGLAAAYTRASMLENVKPENMGKLAVEYMKISKNSLIRSLVDTDKGTKSLKLHKLTDIELDDLIKKAKKDAAFSRGDVMALRLEKTARMRALAKRKAPSVSKLLNIIRLARRRIVRFIEEATCDNALSTVISYGAYSLSAVRLVKSAVKFAGKDLQHSFTKKGIDALKKKNQEKQLTKPVSQKKSEKLYRKQQNKIRQTQKKASKAQSKITQSSKIRRKLGLREKSKKAGFIRKMTTRAKGASGAITKVVSAPFRVVSAAQSLLYKIIGIVVGVIFCLYLGMYVIWSWATVITTVIDGFIPDGMFSAWLGGEDIDPYEDLKEIYAHLKDRGEEIDREAVALLETPQDREVFNGRTIDHYEKTSFRYVNAEGEEVGFSSASAAKSAIALAYLMSGMDGGFYDMPPLARELLVMDLYEYMAGQITFTEIGPYICWGQQISNVHYNCCDDIFYYGCAGSTHSASLSMFNEIRASGARFFENNGSEILSVPESSTGCYYAYLAQCTGHNLENSDGEYITTYYHNRGGVWEGNSATPEADAWYDCPALGRISFIGVDGELYYYEDTGNCHNNIIISKDPQCEGNHTMRVCYGHKDARVTVLREDFNKVCDDRYIPSDPIYNAYIRDFSWDDVEGMRTILNNFVNETDWYNLYGISE